MRTLLIISDTSMWRDAEGRPNVFEPTLREIENVADIFEKITWLGYHRQGHRSGAGRMPSTERIKLVMLKASGGETFLSKLYIILLLPYYFFWIGARLHSHSHIHTRGPSVPAFIGILFNFMIRKKGFWHKFAGNWDKPPGRLYSWQRSILTRMHFSKVTINGSWPGQPRHVLSFENPCFTDQELQLANTLAQTKEFSGKLILCFVGRLEEPKGLGNLLGALRNSTMAPHFQELIVVGDGDRLHYEQSAKATAVPVIFTGGLSRSALNEVYARAHILILPSRSEGFPKVVSEAFAYGCIPIATDVSSIGQYIKNGVNGFLLPDNALESICLQLKSVGVNKALKEISKRGVESSAKFTYSRFVKRISKEVFQLVENT